MGQCADMSSEEGRQAVDAARLPWCAPESGDMLALMTQSYYPVDDDEGGERVTTSVRLPKDVHADIELIATLWNEFDAALGKKRPKKWKASTVIERLIAVGVDGFWQQVGGRPPTKESREAFFRRAIARIRKSPK